MQWTLEQLRQFLLAAESGSFSAAARELGKAQSAISTAISLLEADLGVTLFDRSKRYATLTEAGEVMLLEAREILRQAKALSNRAEALRTGEQAQLCIALDEALPYTVVNEMNRELANRFPYLELTLLHGTATEVVDYVDQSRAHVALHFVRKPLSTELEQVQVGLVPQGIFVVQGHNLLKHSPTQREDLAKYRQLMMEAEDIQETPYSPLVWRADSFYTIAEMVADNLGWAILPVHIGSYQYYRQPLQQLECTALALAPLSVRMLWRQGWQPPATVLWIQQRFTQLLHQAQQQSS